MVTGKPAPMELMRWTMAERFGWTLDYIDSLPLAEIHDWLQIEDGRNTARGSILNKKK